MRVERRGRLVAATVGPAALFLLVFFLVPFAVVVVYALSPAAPGGGVGPGFTLEQLGRLWNVDYLRIVGRSARLAAVATLLTLAIAYPVAWAIARLERRRQLLPLLVIVVPSWINLLIKNYAWITILRREGLVNTALTGLGVTSEPLPLLFTEGAVVVGLVHSYLPFMLLPIYAALDRIEPALIEAARDLGATPGRVFRRIVWPQSLAGVAAGCTFVFVLAFGSFVTPDLLGGARGMMIGNLIQNQILQVRNWPLGAALSVALTVVVVAAIGGALLLANRAQRGRTA
ncbi:MAG: ABC transporter permease [Gemmatimonadota bacterium]|nr:ABC transporter permease [Gemmatimonadota bacterium]